MRRDRCCGRRRRRRRGGGREGRGRIVGRRTREAGFRRSGLRGRRRQSRRCRVRGRHGRVAPARAHAVKAGRERGRDGWEVVEPARPALARQVFRRTLTSSGIVAAASIVAVAVPLLLLPRPSQSVVCSRRRQGRPDRLAAKAAARPDAARLVLAPNRPGSTRRRSPVDSERFPHDARCVKAPRAAGESPSGAIRAPLPLAVDPGGPALERRLGRVRGRGGSVRGARTERAGALARRGRGRVRGASRRVCVDALVRARRLAQEGLEDRRAHLADQASGRGVDSRVLRSSWRGSRRVRELQEAKGCPVSAAAVAGGLP